MSSNLIPGMYPADIYDIYNERLEADQPFVDCIVASINYNIYYNISENLQYYFLYDADEWIDQQDMNQKLRVLDQVIKYFRVRGIHCYIDNTIKFNYGSSQFPGAGFLFPTSVSTILRVQWYVRQGQEYMKAYL